MSVGQVPARARIDAGNFELSVHTIESAYFTHIKRGFASRPTCMYGVAFASGFTIIQ